MLTLLSYSNASAQECPGALSVPAFEWEVECKAETNSSRCGNGLSHELCQENNSRALRNGLLTQDAYNWLQTNGFCAVNIDGLQMIIAICPVGCFEEDTAILSLSEDGAGKWVAAKDITLDDGSSASTPMPCCPRRPSTAAPSSAWRMVMNRPICMCSR